MEKYLQLEHQIETKHRLRKLLSQDGGEYVAVLIRVVSTEIAEILIKNVTEDYNLEWSKKENRFIEKFREKK